MNAPLLLAVLGGFSILGLGWYGHAVSSGWSQMAKRYCTSNTPHYTIGFGVMGIGTEVVGGRRPDGLAQMAVTPEGLYLFMPRLFRLLHPDLLIPWDALSVAPLTDYLPSSCQKLLIRDGTFLMVTMKAYTEMQQHLPHQPNRSRPEWAMGSLF